MKKGLFAFTMLVLSGSINGMYKYAEVRLKGTPKNEQELSRTEVKNLSSNTERYNCISEQTTNGAIVRYNAGAALAMARRMLNLTTPTSPTNKFVPQIEEIKDNLKKAFSPNEKNTVYRKLPFPKNIIKFDEAVQDIYTFSSTLYSPSAKEHEAINKALKTTEQIKQQALTLNTTLVEKEKENISNTIQLTQTSLYNFLKKQPAPSPKKSPVKRKIYKRKRREKKNEFSACKNLLDLFKKYDDTSSLKPNNNTQKVDSLSELEQEFNTQELILSNSQDEKDFVIVLDELESNSRPEKRRKLSKEKRFTQFRCEFKRKKK